MRLNARSLSLILALGDCFGIGVFEAGFSGRKTSARGLVSILFSIFTFGGCSVFLSIRASSAAFSRCWLVVRTVCHAINAIASPTHAAKPYLKSLICLGSL